ncbi:ArnT family glycosyltransferase [Paragemmobacter straminiformis]|uniref:Glycosyltransferase family 39 protein n=1 Tax=Paragemmobacter straminiformis TaxID=2045119 RepID=A0A842I320_9RHOB|nr:glycosyltransferase family 39 protein [Gemmobacter straminiformis]MBC2833873.1 glycosyltransferase family 39 protein [Gemmobacter straminiformis]
MPSTGPKASAAATSAGARSDGAVVAGLTAAGGRGPTLLALALAALALLSLAPRLPHAELWQYDEWYSAERVHGILQGDWLTLRENGLPVFKKPPLQYWLSAGLVHLGLSDRLALRLPSLLAALGTLALTAHLARRLSPHPLAAPVALVLVLSSTLFWISASSAMLDAGAAFLLTAAIAALFAAWQTPRYWWLVALALGLGALQKAPVAALALPLAALMLATGGRPARCGKHALALIPALALLALWPLVTLALHGPDALRVAYLRETLLRFTPAPADWSRHLRWTTWAAKDGVLLWTTLVLAPLALAALSLARAPFVPALGQRRPQARATALLVLVFFAALTAARGEVFDRYLVQILPLAAAGTAALLCALPRNSGPLAAAILTIASGGPLKSPHDAGLTEAGIAPFRPLLAHFHARLTPAEQPVVCGWEKSDQIIFPAALWLLGSGNRPFRRIWSAAELPKALAIANLTPPLRGLCLDTEYAALSRALPLTVAERDAGWVHWTYP